MRATEGNKTEYNKDMGKEELFELFSRYEIVVKDIEIIDEELLANVYLIISDTEQYRIDTIENIVKKLKSIKEELMKEGLIEDIMFSNLFKGIWRILIYFKNEE